MRHEGVTPGEAGSARRYSEGMDEVTVAQDRWPVDIQEYARKWVAIRDGQVVAAADTLDELYAIDGVDPLDVVYPVPPPGPRFV